MEIKWGGQTDIKKPRMIIGTDRTEREGREPRAGHREKERENEGESKYKKRQSRERQIKAKDDRGKKGRDTTDTREGEKRRGGKENVHLLCIIMHYIVCITSVLVI